ncbi:MAG TPA: hypothetical protein HA230_02670 [Candidatus Aenigmarchaeota archaeon]|nr:hypothetical protein [Candidatus Aenigmarchaeota archaeon]
MKRCEITVYDHNATITIDNVLKSFMHRNYKTQYRITMDRKHGTIIFEPPDDSFEERYRELETYLHGSDIKKRLKRTRIDLRQLEVTP